MTRRRKNKPSSPHQERPIGMCGPDEEPDSECIGIAWKLAGYLLSDGFKIVKEAETA